MPSFIPFRCPCCHGSQYRTSAFDVSEKNPYGAKCIFCKSAMTPLLNPSASTFSEQAAGSRQS